MATILLLGVSALVLFKAPRVFHIVLHILEHMAD
jgi:hypothetical protein